MSLTLDHHTNLGILLKKVSAEIEVTRAGLDKNRDNRGVKRALSQLERACNGLKQELDNDLFKNHGRGRSISELNAIYYPPPDEVAKLRALPGGEH